jgi:eukaryotic-like serine/threonine-protein kinase
MLIMTLNNMSDALVQAGDAGGALVYISRAKQLGEELLGTDNSLYHAVATTYAETLAANGQRDAARKEYDTVLALELKTQSPYLGPTLTSRAKLALDDKRFTEAIGFAQRAIAAAEAANGKDSPDLVQPLATLGRALVALAKPADARPHFERAIAIGEKAHLSDKELAPLRALLH